MLKELKSRPLQIAGIAALVSLTACVSTVPVKDMLVDREKFLTTYFAPAKAPVNVKQALDRTPTPAVGFKELRLSFKADYDEDGRKKNIEGKSILLNAGNGLVQQQTELSNNGFPYRVNNQLDYLGMQRIIWNSGFHNQTQTYVTYELKEIKRFDKVWTAKPGDELVFEVTSGTTQQVANYLNSKMTCKASESRPASSVHRGFTGQALPLECKTYGENQTLTAKYDYVFLADYGVAIVTAMTSSKDKLVYEYTGVDAVR